MTSGARSGGSRSPSDRRSALLLGATGLVGGHCLDLLLADPAYHRVHLLARRTVRREGNSKVVRHIVDFDELPAHSEAFAVDDVYCCLGTTIRKAGSREAFMRVDVDYPTIAAELAARQNASSFLVVSAVGADPGSRVFYNRAKGEMERRVRRTGPRNLWIFRPSLLLGERTEHRPGEALASVLMRFLSPVMIGPLRRYRPVHARIVAHAMVAAALGGDPGRIVESEEIEPLAASHR